MARTLDPAAHAVRRDTFLDAAQGLIQSKGYEQMSVQDVLAEVGTSKGAFYHYFDSKAALLEGVIDRMVVVATSTLQPLLDDPDRTALEKFNGMFQGLASWKTQRRDLLIAVLQTWLSDDNAIVREKFRREVVATITPILTAIVRQGVREGTFPAGVSARDWVSAYAGTAGYWNVTRTIAAFDELAREEFAGTQRRLLGRRSRPTDAWRCRVEALLIDALGATAPEPRPASTI